MFDNISLTTNHAKSDSRQLHKSFPEVLQQLWVEDNPKAIKRLVAALEYKSGLTPDEIKEKYAWPEQTVYDWLTVVAERDLND